MTNPAFLIWLVVGGVLTYMVAVDENIYHWLVLQSKLVSLWFKRQWFRIRYNPDSPWVRYGLHRNAQKLAEEIIKERDETND
jgi:hypothetical protein